MNNLPCAILRTQKIKSYAALAALTSHWLRTKPTPNANPARTKYNKIINGNKSPYCGVKELLKKKDISKLRKDGVLAIEYMLAFSPEFLNDKNGKYHQDAKQRLRQWITESKNSLVETYGENCVSIITHFDEKAVCHIHACVCPVKAWKNKAGTNLNKLCARDITGGKKKLSQLQTSYAEHLQCRGVQLKRGVLGSKATHQTLIQYYTAINQSKAACQKVGIIPPSNDPAEFNVWQQTIQKLTESLNKSDQSNFDKLSAMVSDLVVTNQQLEAKLAERQSRPLSR